MIFWSGKFKHAQTSVLLSTPSPRLPSLQKARLQLWAFRSKHPKQGYFGDRAPPYKKEIENAKFTTKSTLKTKFLIKQLIYN